MLGPQAEHFTPASVARFLAEEFVVTPNQDRMGVRLEGTPLERNPVALVTPVVIQTVAYARTTGEALLARGLGEDIDPADVV